MSSNIDFGQWVRLNLLLLSRLREFKLTHYVISILLGTVFGIE